MRRVKEPMITGELHLRLEQNITEAQLLQDLLSIVQLHLQDLIIGPEHHQEVRNLNIEVHPARLQEAHSLNIELQVRLQEARLNIEVHLVLHLQEVAVEVWAAQVARLQEAQLLPVAVDQEEETNSRFYKW